MCALSKFLSLPVLILNWCQLATTRICVLLPSVCFFLKRLNELTGLKSNWDLTVKKWMIVLKYVFQNFFLSTHILPRNSCNPKVIIQRLTFSLYFVRCSVFSVAAKRNEKFEFHRNIHRQDLNFLILYIIVFSISCRFSQNERQNNLRLYDICQI